MMSGPNYRPDIQGLRAVAVMLVVIYHSGIGLVSGGYIGVDVFFVISGYLIAGPMILSLQETGRIDLPRFYTRRICRLLPAAVFILIVTILVFRKIYSPLELKLFSSSAIATGAYLSNFWFAHLSLDYLADNSAPNPLLHTWSLSVEEQFYIMWPVMFIAIHKLAGTNQRPSFLFWSTVVISCLSFGACVLLTSYAQPWAFFLCFTRFWEFGLGALAGLLVSKKFRLDSRLASAGAFLGALLILVPALSYSKDTLFPGYLASLPALGTALLICCVAQRTTPLGYIFLSNPLAKYLGDISYSLYLWHWPVFIFMAAQGSLDDRMEQLAGILIAILLAATTYALIENPIRFHKGISAHYYRTLALAALLTIGGLGAGSMIREEAKAGLELPTQKALLAIKKTKPKIYADECHNQFLDATLNNCSYGNKDGGKTIALFGDSHAAHWFPALEIVAKAQGAQLVSYTKSSCPSIMFEPYDANYKRQYTECTAWKLRVISALRTLKPDYLVISNSYEYQQSEQLGTETWGSQLTELIKTLNLEQTQIVLFHDVPQLPFDGPVCLARADWQKLDPKEVCSFNRDTAINPDVINIEKHVAAKWAHVSTFDPTTLICAENNCGLTEDATVKYFDSNHLSVAFSAKLADDINQMFLR